MLTGDKLGSAISIAIKKKIASGAVKTKIQIAQHFGVAPPSLHDWINRGTIGKDKLPMLWDYFSDVVGPQHWGLDNYPTTSTSDTLNHIHQLDDDTVVINKFGTGGRMGKGLILHDQPGLIDQIRVTKKWLNKNVSAHTSDKNLCVVTGFGDSMKPTYNSGDPLIVDLGVKVVDFDAVFFFRIGDEGFIKRLQRIPGQGLTAKSDNPLYDSWVITDDMDFEIFGRVLKAWESKNF